MSQLLTNSTAAYRRLGVFTFLLSVAFAVILVRWCRFALHSELQSYILLIPVLSAYLLYQRRTEAFPRLSALPADGRVPAFLLWGAALALLALHGVLTAGHLLGTKAGDPLCLPVAAYVTALLGGFLFTCGRSAFRAVRFPLLFLYVMTPIPEAAAHLLRVALQHGSAEAAHGLFVLTGTSVFREGLIFQLPGLTIQVAEECSGIHSSLVLLITSLVAAHLFLRRTWTRATLILFVIPLCLLRNGFRVVSLVLLTLHVDAGIMDSPLHHQGGPIYFVLSLVVFFAVLLGLRKWEKKRVP